MIQALQRGAAILREVAAAGSLGVKLADLSRSVALNKTTTFHLAETLVAEGLLTKVDGQYHIGTFFKSLAGAAAVAPWYETWLPPLGEVHRRFPKFSFILSELGEGDLFMRHEFRPEDPGVGRPVPGQTLNPYTSVAGLLHFAWLPEERLSDLRLRHPFEVKGLDHWGSLAAFEKAVAKCRRDGYSETPKLVHGEQMKFGVPLFEWGNRFRGTLTCTAVRKQVGDEAETRGAILAECRRVMAGLSAGHS